MFGEKERVIFLDLDDTIINTYQLIIQPADTQFVRLVQRELGNKLVGQFGSALDYARRAAPNEIEQLIEFWFGERSDVVKKILSTIDAYNQLDKLNEDSFDKVALKTLADSSKLVLLTQGEPDYQSRKIDKLELNSYFDEIEIISPNSRQTKFGFLSEYQGSHKNCWVVGNRLDNEIFAGVKLDMLTVWVRKGEGSLRVPQGTALPKPLYAADSLRQAAFHIMKHDF